MIDAASQRHTKLNIMETEIQHTKLNIMENKIRKATVYQSFDLLHSSVAAIHVEICDNICSLDGYCLCHRQNDLCLQLLIVVVVVRFRTSDS
uniref:Uncharacterized protein n=1 Tax=Romanomermis culicivorax TaxID=13658 RepID=A0A915HVH8_ROMCU